MSIYECTHIDPQYWCQIVTFFESQFIKLYLCPYQVSFLHVFTSRHQTDGRFFSISSLKKHHISAVGILSVFIYFNPHQLPEFTLLHIYFSKFWACGSRFIDVAYRCTIHIHLYADIPLSGFCYISVNLEFHEVT